MTNTRDLHSHGLSYTTFAYSDIRTEGTTAFGVNVSFTVKNTGKVSGAEAAQVYVHALSSRVERPDVELKGFAKVLLEPGESKRLEVNLDVSVMHISPLIAIERGSSFFFQHQAFSFYDVQKQGWVGEAGCYEIRVGGSSIHTALSVPFVLEKSFSWVGVKEPWVLL